MGLGRKPQSANDWKSVTITRDGEGGGDFPNVNAAFEYLAGVTFTPSVEDPFEIVLGPGTHTLDNTSITTLPTGTILRGSGPSATTLRGSNSANDLFQVGDCSILDLSFSNCETAVTRTFGSSLMRMENVFATGVGTLYSGGAGIQIIQGCNITGGNTNPSFVCNGGTVYALLNCFFNAIPSNSTRVDVNGGRFAMRDCVFDASLSTNVEGVRLNGTSKALPQEIVSNDFINVQEPVVFENGNYLCILKDTVVNGETAGITIEGAGGTNTADIFIDNFLGDSSNFVMNENTPKLCFVSNRDGTIESGNEMKTYMNIDLTAYTYWLGNQ